MNPIKPNFLCCLFGLLLVGLLAMWLYSSVTDTLKALMTAATVGEAQRAALSLMGHVVGGGSLLVPVVSGIVAWGIKLLDERPEPGPTVPADMHRQVIELVLADGRQVVDQTRRLAGDVE